jgi:hypothetical protein
MCTNPTAKPDWYSSYPYTMECCLPSGLSLHSFVLNCVLTDPCALHSSFFVFLVSVMWQIMLWYGGQRSWLQIQRSRVRFLELPNMLSSETGRGPLSLVRITEALFEWKSSDSGLENRVKGREDSLFWQHNTPVLTDRLQRIGRYSSLTD